MQQAVRYDGRFRDTAVWAMGQRRWVWLQGCVTTADQAAQIEALVRLIDDVEGIVNKLMVGISGTPAYRIAP